MDDGGSDIVVAARTVVDVMVIVIVMFVAMMIVVSSAKQPRARDVYCQAKAGNRDRLRKPDRHRSKQAIDGFVTIKAAMIANTIALLYPARSPNLPVPKANLESWTCLRA
jgi:hypothetical protein